MELLRTNPSTPAVPERLEKLAHRLRERHRMILPASRAASESVNANICLCVSGGENEMQHGRLTMDVNAGLKMLMFQ